MMLAACSRCTLQRTAVSALFRRWWPRTCLLLLPPASLPRRATSHLPLRTRRLWGLVSCALEAGASHPAWTFALRCVQALATCAPPYGCCRLLPGLQQGQPPQQQQEGQQQVVLGLDPELRLRQLLLRYGGAVQEIVRAGGPHVGHMATALQLPELVAKDGFRLLRSCTGYYKHFGPLPMCMPAARAMVLPTAQAERGGERESGGEVERSVSGGESEVAESESEVAESESGVAESEPEEERRAADDGGGAAADATGGRCDYCGLLVKPGSAVRCSGGGCRAARFCSDDAV
jgi:hypothetical protein